MCTHNRAPVQRSEHGLSLIELVMFIVIVSVAAVGVLNVMNLGARHSVDPLLQKQALAIAEALLEEVELMPFTTCDPDAFDAITSACTLPEAMGPEAGEVRGDAVTPFDNVNDYHGFTLAAAGTDLAGATNVVVPAGYSATVAVTTDAAFGPVATPLPAAAALRVAVTVTYAGGESVVVEGYRTRYAPTP